MSLTPLCTEVRNRGEVMVSGDIYEQDGGFSRSPEAQVLQTCRTTRQERLFITPICRVCGM